MAWQKDIEDEFGNVFGFYDIEKLSLVKTNGILEVSVSGWKDQSAMDEDKKSITKSYQITPSNTQLVMQVLAAVQAEMIALPEFQGAVVV